MRPHRQRMLLSRMTTGTALMERPKLMSRCERLQAQAVHALVHVHRSPRPALCAAAERVAVAGCNVAPEHVQKPAEAVLADKVTQLMWVRAGANHVRWRVGRSGCAGS